MNLRTSDNFEQDDSIHLPLTVLTVEVTHSLFLTVACMGDIKFELYPVMADHSSLYNVFLSKYH
jgi:hypothetical protein